MRADFSEFSYGYALTTELARSAGPLQAAPVFPSLRAEGQAGGGYDVRIDGRPGVPLFLQFKLAEGMVRRTAREAKQGLLEPVFYRMPLMPGRFSRQHQMLLDLEKASRLVFYAAPMFHRADEFNAAYIAEQISARSFFLQPSQIGPLRDDDDHHIAYRDNYPWFFYSKPRPGSRAAGFMEFTEIASAEMKATGRVALSAENLQRLRSSMLAIVKEQTRADLRSLEERSWDRLSVKMAELDKERTWVLAQIAYMSLAFFGCHCFVVGQRGSD